MEAGNSLLGTGGLPGKFRTISSILDFNLLDDNGTPSTTQLGQPKMSLALAKAPWGGKGQSSSSVRTPA